WVDGARIYRQIDSAVRVHARRTIRGGNQQTVIPRGVRIRRPHNRCAIAQGPGRSAGTSLSISVFAILPQENQPEIRDNPEQTERAQSDRGTSQSFWREGTLRVEHHEHQQKRKEHRQMPAQNLKLLEYADRERRRQTQQQTEEKITYEFGSLCSKECKDHAR